MNGCWALDDRQRLWLTLTGPVTPQAITRTIDFQIAPARLLCSISLRYAAQTHISVAYLRRHAGHPSDDSPPNAPLTGFCRA